MSLMQRSGASDCSLTYSLQSRREIILILASG
jgi:hypothetical protein